MLASPLPSFFLNTFSLSTSSLGCKVLNLDQMTGSCYDKKKKNTKKKKENLPNCGLGCPGWPQSKIEGKRKEEWVPGPDYGIEKL